MAPRTVYANLGDGFQPFTLWDQSLADMGALGVIPCTAAGTNAIVLSPVGTVFSPSVTTPNALQVFSFLATASSTAPVTLQVGSSGALKLYRADGVTQIGAAEIQSGWLYTASYNAALNSSAGGFQISGSASVGASTSQYITAGTTVTVSATDGLIVINKASGSPTTVNLPAALTKVGKVKIVDFKGDSDVNNITVNRSGSDVFNGGLTSWVIAAPGASTVFDPVVNGGSGIGYAV
jgi:hypothetical protein